MVNYGAEFLHLGERGKYMKCNNCGMEIPENTKNCPNCGKKDAPKVTKIILGAIGGLVILAVLVVAILYGMGVNLLPRENNIHYKDSYTVKDSVLEDKVDTVVATMGDITLTSGELQFFYWQTVFGFINDYGSVLGSVGLDIYKPLDKQVYDEETGMTFQQIFLQMAFDNWSRYAAMNLLAQEDDFKLSEEAQKVVDSMKDDIEAAAKKAGYTDVEKYVDEAVIPSSSFHSYLSFNTMSYKALAYYDALNKKMQPTAEEIEAYYQAHEEDLKKKGYGKDAGYYYDVRHILVAIEGQKDSNGNYSDEAWQACLEKAQNMLDGFLTGEGTEEAFAALATANSADPGSKNNGGLYAGLTKNTGFIANFKNWYMDESRQPGDTGIVKNTESATQGYHIMFLSNRYPIWETEIKTLIADERTSKLLDEAVDRWPVEIDFSKIILGNIDFAAY